MAAEIASRRRSVRGPLTLDHWSDVLDPAQELDPAVRVRLAARVRSAWAGHLGRQAAAARRRPTTEAP